MKEDRRHDSQSPVVTPVVSTRAGQALLAQLVGTGGHWEPDPDEPGVTMYVSDGPPRTHDEAEQIAAIEQEVRADIKGAVSQALAECELRGWLGPEPWRVHAAVLNAISSSSATEPRLNAETLPSVPDPLGPPDTTGRWTNATETQDGERPDWSPDYSRGYSDGYNDGLKHPQTPDDRDREVERCRDLPYDAHDWNSNGSPSFCRDCGIGFPKFAVLRDDAGLRASGGKE